MEIFGFGISGPEFLIILLVMLLVLGPSQIISALRNFSKLIAAVRGWSARLREATHSDLANSDLSGLKLDNLQLEDLDLKNYDPRQMIRDAVKEEMQAWMNEMKKVSSPPPGLNPPDSTKDDT